MQAVLYKGVQMERREGRGDAVEMHRYRALTPVAFREFPWWWPKRIPQQQAVTARVHGSCRVWLKEKKIHFCVKTHKHILSHFHFPFSQTMHYLWGMFFFSSSCRSWPCCRGGLWVAFYHSVSITLIELGKTQFLWFATENGHGQKLKASWSCNSNK